MEHRKIAFIGAGNMARSIIAGLVASEYPAEAIIATGPNQDKIDVLHQQYGVNVTTDNLVAVQQADVVVLAVKPQLMEQVISELKAVDVSNKLVISIAAGIAVERLEQMFESKLNIVRVMPNTPSLVSRGMSGLYAKPQLAEVDKQFASQLMQAVGETCWVEQESGINNIIAAAGSAPAYFFLFMEAIQQEAIRSGFDKQTARLLVQQTALGAAEMVVANPDIELDTLRSQVTSKGGTTAEAIRTFEESDIRGIVARSMQAAVNRAQEMEKLF
ncbi:pyrroline-5-carboxylate reductase [Vibrio hippocampi]|uniref:Pyrroline-5-carboxylate reductase n=1 Tax=Vibrio hippocampi TaxID=654686 RepID=A0ABN8DHX8_9VIBR|nr:pyrroline-5-carboxylate reductase [Vibrio hippocampi]CAH0527022.1 Pyrroline-5-carboxylate reductase [Vibrio hippocampi]